MSDISGPLEFKNNQPQKAQKDEIPPPEPHQLIHDIVNELTIMNLCCFKVRRAIDSGFDPSISISLEKMEQAMGEIMTVLLKRFSPSNKGSSSKATSSNPRDFQILPAEPATSKVYRLFSPKRRSRR